MWKHNFYCLCDRDAVSIPGQKREKKQLLDAGLGEKRIEVEQNCSSTQLHDCLLAAFPLLSDCGGYSLLRCVPNSRNLQLLQPPETGHNPVSLKEAVGQSRIYIRPLQKSIVLTQRKEIIEVSSYISKFN